MVLALMIVITNLPLINANFTLSIDGPGKFKYSNGDASYTRIQGLGFKNPSISHTGLKWFLEEQKPTPNNSELFRIYKINPLCFWRWPHYLFTSVNFKYKSWKKIGPNRVPYDSTNMWQDF